MDIAKYVPDKTYDAIALVFIHLPDTLRIAFHQTLSAALNPGGTLIVEAFAKDQLKYSSGGPKDPELLYSLEDLREDFSSLECLECEARVVLLEEGQFHAGPGCVLRYLGRKPAESLSCFQESEE